MGRVGDHVDVLDAHGGHDGLGQLGLRLALEDVGEVDDEVLGVADREPHDARRDRVRADVDVALEVVVGAVVTF